MSRTLLVRGFAPGTTKRDLLALFAPYSSALSARLLGARGPSSPRRCIVRMRAAEEAGRAARDLDGREYQGHVLRIDVVGRPRPEGAADVPAPRSLFPAMALERDTAPAEPAPLAISFVVSARAFGQLADNLAALRPSARSAVDAARDRGGIAATYDFIDLTDDVARDIRNVLRGRSRRQDPDGRACDAAASAIEARRRVAWHLVPCPRCGGRLGPTSWLTPAVFVLRCDTCHWAIPK